MSAPSSGPDLCAEVPDADVWRPPPAHAPCGRVCRRRSRTRRYGGAPWASLEQPAGWGRIGGITGLPVAVCGPFLEHNVNTCEHCQMGRSTSKIQDTPQPTHLPDQNSTSSAAFLCTHGSRLCINGHKPPEAFNSTGTESKTRPQRTVAFPFRKRRASARYCCCTSPSSVQTTHPHN